VTPSSTDRDSWDAYFMKIAHDVAGRATCLRGQVGAVAVISKCIVATGYNGSIAGTEHCVDEGVGCLMEAGHCVRCLHAENNAIIQAAARGVRVEGATFYITHSPCWPCFMMLANVGAMRIVYGRAYRMEDPGPQRVVQYAQRLGIELVQFTEGA
jgi:dCMP deaminase